MYFLYDKNSAKKKFWKNYYWKTLVAKEEIQDFL
jgi:hypothetical protein